MEIGDRIKSRREELGMSQEELAKKLKKPLDYSLRMIYNIIIKKENKRNSIPEGSGERWK